jgi:hypothetical protein
VAALPIIVLLGLLAGLKVRPHLCAIAGAATAMLCAIFVVGMPASLALSSFFYGSAFGLLKIVWIVIAAVFLYDISVETGQFEIMKQSVAAITPDRRLQLLLVAFCFGAFIEGSAGFGAPVAIAGAFMIGLGFKPFQAAALNLIANTAPVAWGAIGWRSHGQNGGRTVHLYCHRGHQSGRQRRFHLPLRLLAFRGSCGDRGRNRHVLRLCLPSIHPQWVKLHPLMAQFSSIRRTESYGC